MKRVVLLTGGTSGIGLATAKMFWRQGDRVVLMGRNTKRGQEALAEMKKIGASMGECLFLPGDVTKVIDCHSAVEETVSRCGRLDVLVNSAGLYTEQAVEDTTERDFNAVMDTNVKGTFFMAKYALAHLRRTKGNIVNVASDAGIKANFGCAAYCTSKGAVTMFTKALALDVAWEGIRVNCVCPGDIMTPMVAEQLSKEPLPEAALQQMSGIYPLGRIGTPEEVAAVIVFLASPQAAFVTGALWSIDGGLTA